MADTKKSETAGGTDGIQSALEKYRTHLEKTKSLKDPLVESVSTSIRLRMDEFISQKPRVRQFYETVEEHLANAHVEFQKQLDADPKSDDKKKTVEEIANARRAAMELGVTYQQRSDAYAKSQSDKAKAEHDSHEKKQTETRNAWWKSVNNKYLKGEGPVSNPFTWPSKILYKRVWQNTVLGKGSDKNPLTWPSKAVQFAAKAVPEHVPAVALGALVGAVMASSGGSIPVGIAAGAVAFPTIQKFFEEKVLKKQAGGDSHGDHGGGHH